MNFTSNMLQLNKKKMRKTINKIPENDNPFNVLKNINFK